MPNLSIMKAITILNNPEADMTYSKQEINKAHLLAIEALEQLNNRCTKCPADYCVVSLGQPCPLSEED